jgi:hypothetical protein
MTTLTEVFPCFFLSCKANARVKPAKTGHGPHSSIVFVLFYVLFVCKSVLYCTTATGWLPNCCYQTYITSYSKTYWYENHVTGTTPYFRFKEMENFTEGNFPTNISASQYVNKKKKICNSWNMFNCNKLFKL